MRIALATEEFAPSSAPVARVARDLTAQLTGAGHQVLVVAGGRGCATFRGADVVWVSRLSPVSTIRSALAQADVEICHLLDPHRIGLKAAEAAEQVGVPTVYLGPRTWLPGVDPDRHHPGLRDHALRGHWAQSQDPDGGQLVVGYVGPATGRKVRARLRRIASLPGVQLVVLGDGPDAASLRQVDATVIPGVTGVERDRCLASFDVLVQPRKGAEYAPEVLESLASGVPVITFDGAPGAERITHADNGLLVDPGRGARALAREVARVAASPGLCEAMIAGARASVLDRDWDHALTDLLDRHYPAALAQPAASQARPA